MARDSRGTTPPRPIAPGDIVACFSDDLGEWAAAQVTDLNPSWKTAGVLELNWSGPEPSSVEDLGRVSPLVLTHHAWSAKTSHTNYEWVLPRSYKVIGSLPLMREGPSGSYSTGWDVGEQLAYQRRWDRGDREALGRPGELKLKGSQFDAFLAEYRHSDILALKVDEVKALDCAPLVEVLPGLRRLMFSGALGRLENAGHLNRLSSLKVLAITNLFGMTKSDVLLPGRAPALEWLALHSVPREYGAAMRSAWAPELAKGCYTVISGLRTPDWLAENLENPLRDWDGREHISAAKFRRSVAQYKATRQAVLAAIADPAAADFKARLVELGREFGQAFNKLAKSDDFIETEEREELFAALIAIPEASGSLSGEAANEAAGWLEQGLDEARDW
jgi:hypothetical protein